MDPSNPIDVWNTPQTYTFGSKQYQVRYHPIEDEGKMVRFVAERIGDPLQKLRDAANLAANGDKELYAYLIKQGWEAAYKEKQSLPPKFGEPNFIKEITQIDGLRFVLGLALNTVEKVHDQEVLRIFTTPEYAGPINLAVTWYLFARDSTEDAQTGN